MRSHKVHGETTMTDEVHDFLIKTDGRGFRTEIFLDGKPLHHVSSLSFHIDSPDSFLSGYLTVRTNSLLLSGRYKFTRIDDYDSKGEKQ